MLLKNKIKTVPSMDCQSLACKTVDSIPSSSCCICSCTACQGMWQICLGTWRHTTGGIDKEEGLGKHMRCLRAYMHIARNWEASNYIEHRLRLHSTFTQTRLCLQLHRFDPSQNKKSLLELPEKCFFLPML